MTSTPVDDIKQATMRRFKRVLAEAGFEAVVQGNHANTVPVWFYSLSPNQGCRLILQMSVENYRQADKPIALPKSSRLEPWDVLGNVLSDYDKLESREERLKAHADLATALVLYISHTKTWQLMPKAGQGPGIHVVVSDWVKPDGHRVLRPFAAFSEKVLTVDDLAAAFSISLDLHLAKYPDEAPVFNRNTGGN